MTDYITEPTTKSRMMTHSGVYFDLYAPDPDLVSLADIAHGLSRLARFNGHTNGPWPLTVAQHSVLVGDLVRLSSNKPWLVHEEALVLAAAAMHDAHEAYVGDITYPAKMTLDAIAQSSLTPFGNSGLACLKARVQQAIHESLCLPFPIPAAWAERIKLADSAALVLEREKHMPQGNQEQWFESEAFALDFDPTDSSAYEYAWGHDHAKHMLLGWLDIHAGVRRKSTSSSAVSLSA